MNNKKRYEKYRNAIEATENEVLFYNDTYAWTPFHQSNTGMSRSAEEVLGSSEFPYIKVKECPADKESEDRSAYLRFPMIKYRKNVIIFWRQRQTEKKLRQDILLKILKF